MPNQRNQSGLDRALHGLDTLGHAVSDDSQHAGQQAHRGADQASNAADQANHGLESADHGLQDANAQYHRATGHDSGLLTGADDLVHSVEHAAAPVVNFAHELRDDANDVQHVADAGRELGTDVSTTAHDGQTTVNDGHTAIND